MPHPYLLRRHCYCVQTISTLLITASKDKWCLDVSSISLQSTLALCQKGLGIVRVYDFQNQDKENLKKELDVFGYANFIIAELDENIEAPENGGRVLLIIYQNIINLLYKMYHF